MCVDLRIKQELVHYGEGPPIFIGVADRALGIIQAVSLAARIQASHIFPHVDSSGHRVIAGGGHSLGVQRSQPEGNYRKPWE